MQLSVLSYLIPLVAVIQFTQANNYGTVAPQAQQLHPPQFGLAQLPPPQFGLAPQNPQGLRPPQGDSLQAIMAEEETGHYQPALFAPGQHLQQGFSFNNGRVGAVNYKNPDGSMNLLAQGGQFVIYNPGTQTCMIVRDTRWSKNNLMVEKCNRAQPFERNTLYAFQLQSSGSNFKLMQPHGGQEFCAHEDRTGTRMYPCSGGKFSVYSIENPKDKILFKIRAANKNRCMRSTGSDIRMTICSGWFKGEGWELIPL